MIAVINKKAADSVQWVRGSDTLYQLILLNDDGTLLDASAVGTVVTVRIYLEPLKTGSGITIIASKVGDGSDGEHTFLIANNQASLEDLRVGYGYAIDVELDLAAGGDINKQENQINLVIS